MRGYELLDKLTLIDPSFIEAAAAEPRKEKRGRVRWFAAAACLCLILLSVLRLPRVGDIPEDISPSHDLTVVPEQPEGPVGHPPVVIIPGTEPDASSPLIFNDADGRLDSSRLYIPGYFTKELKNEEITAMLPAELAGESGITASAGFNGEGALLEVFLNIDVPSLSDTIRVTFSSGVPNRCYTLPDEPIISPVNGREFTLYQWTADGSSYTLEAQSKINGWSMQISCTATAGTLEKDKTAFAEIVRLFAAYGDDQPDFSAITAENIPEFINCSITLSEAWDDPDFGAYMLNNPPEGFAEESLRRYKDQNSDYLSGLWSKGLAYLSWAVSPYNEEDAGRLTDIAQRENYDLSLYPIPRANSVPEALREVVDNPIFTATELTLETVYARSYKTADAGDIDGWRMRFSVRYGSTVVEVSAKGVDPEWVYQQLTLLLDE